MSANSGAIFAGLGQDLVTGTLNSGVYGATLPPVDTTFFEATLDSELRDAGYIGESGVRINQGRSFTDIKDMDGNVLETIQTDSNGTIQTNLLELNQVNMENLFGEENVTVGASNLTHGSRLAVAVSLGEDRDPMTHVFRMKSGSKRAGLVVPRGRFTDIGEIGFTNSGAASVDVTIKAIPVFNAGLGKPVDFFLFLDDGVFAVSLVPIITSVTPSGQGVGEAVLIKGNRFTGTVVTTGVKFGGVNATSFEVINDGEIIAVLPAGSAGTVQVVVTNASGFSANFPYVRT